MTDVVASKVQVTRYQWTVPASSLTGGVVGDVHFAIEAAENVAREHGVNTEYDDWLRIKAADDEVVFYFEVENQEDVRSETKYRLVPRMHDQHQGVHDVPEGVTVRQEIARLEERGYTVPRVQAQTTTTTETPWRDMPLSEVTE